MKTFTAIKPLIDGMALFPIRSPHGRIRGTKQRDDRTTDRSSHVHRSRIISHKRHHVESYFELVLIARGHHPDDGRGVFEIWKYVLSIKFTNRRIEPPAFPHNPKNVRKLSEACMSRTPVGKTVVVWLDLLKFV